MILSRQNIRNLSGSVPKLDLSVLLVIGRNPIHGIQNGLPSFTNYQLQFQYLYLYDEFPVGTMLQKYE